jgi:hypothetical protein
MKAKFDKVNSEEEWTVNAWVQSLP